MARRRANRAAVSDGGSHSRVSPSSGEGTAWAEANGRLRELIDMTLHDLRSPLASVLVGLEVVEQALARQDLDRVRAALALVLSTVRRLSRIVDSLLDVSRLEAGQAGLLRRAPVDLNELVSEAAREVGFTVTARGLHLQVELLSDSAMIAADRDMVFRAVINLLENAIKFSLVGGQVSLKTARAGKGFSISVTDQGPGIPGELQRNLFDRSAGAQWPTASGGYGLGLVFCKAAAEAHGGQVMVDSVPGRGSTFTLWFPEA